MNDGALSFDRVTVRYGDRVALRDVSMRAPPGEVVALAGPNGSGKSTLLRASVGLEPHEDGAIDLGGERLQGLSLRARARRVAWMPQEEPPGDNLLVPDYVRYGRYPHLAAFVPPTPRDGVAVENALRLSGADDLRDRYLWELSGGERQRVRFARVLAQEAPIVLLDEPTAHLDIGHQLDLLERVRSIAHEHRTAVVVALHDLNLAARFADRIVVLHRGRVAADGVPRAILSPRLLSDVWGIASELRYDAQSRLPYLIPRIADVPPTAPSPGGPVRPRVHVLAGGGSGVELIRRLVDSDYSVSAGALPLFDSDCALTEELRIPTAVEVPFAPISAETRSRVRAFLEESEAVVVGAFPVGPTNLANLEELRGFARPGTVLLLAQAGPGPWDFTGGRATEIRSELLRRGATEIRTVDQVLAELASRLPRG